MAKVGFETRLSGASEPDPIGWRRIVPLVVLSLVFLATGVGALFAVDFVGHDPCHTGVAAEASTIEAQEERSFPPRWTCSYEFETGFDNAAIAPPKSVVYDASPALIAVATAGVALLLYGVWFVRSVRRLRS